MKLCSSVLAVIALTTPCLAQRSIPVQFNNAYFADGPGTSVALSGAWLVCGGTGSPPIADHGVVSFHAWVGFYWAEGASTSASDGTPGDRFGWSVAISGDTAVVGAYRADVGASTDQGAVYIFTYSAEGWTEQVKLTASDGGAGDHFGYSVSIDGNTLVVGANVNQGAAYVFTRSGSTWSQTAKLLAPDGAADDHFGAAVAVADDWILVGAPDDDQTPGDNRGSVHTFLLSDSGWTHQAKLIGNGSLGNATGERFGASLAIDDQFALAGAPDFSITSSVSVGAAYPLACDGLAWSIQPRITLGGGSAGDRFGEAVALSGKSVLIGAPGDSVGSLTNRGSAYLYTRPAPPAIFWGQPLELFSNDSEANDNYGAAVAIAEAFAAVGAPRDQNSNGSVWVFSRVAGDWVAPTQRFSPADGVASDHFGSSSFVSGDYAVVGAPDREVGGNTDRGAAYVYVRSGMSWSQQAVLTAPDGEAGDNFGHAVSISGDTIVVTAPEHSTGSFGTDNRGAAYVFTRSGTTWTQQAKLTASNAFNNDRLGSSVAIDANTVIVGCHRRSTGRGSAYIYFRTGTTWSQQAAIDMPSGASNDNFGWSVALSGDTALIGAPGDDFGLLLSQGSAFVFVRTGSFWNQQTRLIADDGDFGHEFGYAVALNGDEALIGAGGADSSPSDASGAAYFYKRTGLSWVLAQKLFPNDAASGDRIGDSVAFSDQVLLLGSPGALGDRGNVSVFTRFLPGWAWNLRQHAPDGLADDRFSHSVSLSGNTALVGAPDDDVGANAEQGSAYFLDVPFDDYRLAYNETDNFVMTSLTELINFVFSSNNISVLVSEASPRFSGFANGQYRSIALRSTGDLIAGPARVFTLGNISSLSPAPGGSIRLYGTLFSDPNSTINVLGDPLFVAGDGLFTGRDNSVTTFAAAKSRFEGPMSLFVGASAHFAGSLRTIAPITMAEGSSLTVADSLINIDTHTIDTALVSAASYSNRESIIITGESEIAAALTNRSAATILLNSGSLLVTGSFHNSGNVLGTICPTCAATSLNLPPNLTITGNMIHSAGAGFIMPYADSTVAVGGNADTAIDSNARFALSLATLQLESSGPEQTLEVMSLNIGANFNGLNRNFPGHFPLGTLEIGPAPSTVRLVDIHDNDLLGQGACEAIYVDHLRIHPGSRLINPSCRIYYNTIQNQGTIDFPANLVSLVETCPADGNNDGFVDDVDFILFAAAYDILDCADPSMPPGCPADLNFDGLVEDSDFILFAAAYNELLCP